MAVREFQDGYDSILLDDEPEVELSKSEVKSAAHGAEPASETAEDKQASTQKLALELADSPAKEHADSEFGSSVLLQEEGHKDDPGASEDKQKCPPTERLRQIFEELGVPAAELRKKPLKPAFVADKFRGARWKQAFAVARKGEPSKWAFAHLRDGCVVHLDLSRRAINGTLNSLAELTKLKRLYLSNTGVSGGLDALRQMDELERLCLKGTKVSGHLDQLANLTKLKELTLTNTGVSGGLEPLSEMKKLWRLLLLGTKVSGHLDPLANLTKLKWLYLSNTGVSGGLDALRQMDELERLWLEGTKVSGHLDPLANLTNLKELHLTNTGVSGGLEPLSEMKKLRKLSLVGTKVSGHLDLLARHTKLEKLALTNTGVSGGLDALRQMDELERLWLEGTKVRGHLDPLANLTKLKELTLTNTGVSGGLEPLSEMNKLWKLSLGGTKVSGHLDLLANLTKLKQLLLRNTTVSGAVEVLRQMEQLREADLSFTLVHGRLESSWRGKLPHLHLLLLAGSRVHFLPVGKHLRDLTTMFYTKTMTKLLLPALTSLVSGCPLDGPVEHLLIPFWFSERLGQIRANGANLSGQLWEECLRGIFLQGKGYLRYCDSPLQRALQGLELADNRIRRAARFHSRVYISLANNSGISLDMHALRKALKRNLQVDLTRTKVKNTQEVRELFVDNFLQRTAEVTQSSRKEGFACFDVTSTSLRISPPLFWPAGLCACSEGFHGSGTQCDKCQTGFYNQKFNNSCTACPSNASTAEPGSTSVDSCICKVGRLLEDTSKPGQQQKACQCDAGKALYLAKPNPDGWRNDCEDCGRLHLDCQHHGLHASSAPPQGGYARLEVAAQRAYRCLEPAEMRCNASNGTALGCAAGHEGPLCVACSWGHRKRAGICVPCAVGFDVSTRWLYFRWVAGAAVLAAVVGAVFAWRRSRNSSAAPAAPTVPQELTLWSAMKPLLAAQGPVLLQLFQLWGLLVALLPPEAQVGAKGADERAAGLWPEEYVQLLQLTAQGFRDATSLECWFGRTVNSVLALAGPCVPLVLLALCVVWEVASHGTGTGVSLALNLLTLLYIGGASSCAALVHCQHTDGGKEWLGDFAFRTALPDIKCQDPAWIADGIALFCVVCYGLLIPSFLVYLMFKQHLALAPSRRFVSLAEKAPGSITVWVLPVVASKDSKSEPEEETTDEMKTKSLLAAAVAHSCIHFTSSVRVQLCDESLILQAQEVDQERVDLDASSMLWKALRSKHDADLRRCQALERMLKERYVLAQAASSDRIVAGAKELLMKYAACQNVWFEVAMRIVAVALVAAIGSESLEFTLGFTLCAAVAIGTVRPFRQHQVNDLQCLCFLCLAVAAASFSKGWVNLARASLLAPCMMASMQVLKPDGPEALALRLFQDAESKWPSLQDGEAVELSLQSISLL